MADPASAKATSDRAGAIAEAAPDKMRGSEEKLFLSSEGRGATRSTSTGGRRTTEM